MSDLYDFPPAAMQAGDDCGDDLGDYFEHETSKLVFNQLCNRNIEKGNYTMSIYDYKLAIYNDINDYLDQEGIGFTMSADYMVDHYYDQLLSSGVTGADDGSYTHDRITAGMNLVGNGELVRAALVDTYGSRVPVGALDAENVDVCIRCYLLHDIMRDVFTDMSRKLEAEGLPF